MDDTHITLDDSNTTELNVHVAGDGYTVGALPAVPIEYVPPESGEKYPLVSVFRLVTDAMPAVPDDVATNSPPSGEIAIPRPEPVTARDDTPPDWPLFITWTP